MVGRSSLVISQCVFTFSDRFLPVVAENQAKWSRLCRPMGLKIVCIGKWFHIFVPICLMFDEGMNQRGNQSLIVALWFSIVLRVVCSSSYFIYP